MRVGTPPAHRDCKYALWVGRLQVRMAGNGRSTSPSSTCTLQTGAKYTRRPGPPFPANECRGQRKIGNNGRWYVSKPDQRGVHRWVKVLLV